MPRPPDPVRIADESYESSPSITKGEMRKRLQVACAIAHGCGANLSLLELNELVLEKGLPPREERERILSDRLGDDTTYVEEPVGAKNDFRI